MDGGGGKGPSEECIARASIDDVFNVADVAYTHTHSRTHAYGDSDETQRLAARSLCYRYRNEAN